MRLHVYLAHSGVASRRECERIIAEGRVTVNGEIITRAGTMAEEGDVVTVDGRQVGLENKTHYIALNKPPEFICTQNDPEQRPEVRLLIPPAITERLYSVGRLDFLSSGLLLMTNDGAFTAALSHPSSEITKEYVVETTSPVPDNLLEAFLRGITVEGVYYRCREIEKCGEKKIRVVLIEGKNREIRRVLSHFRLHAVVLRRVRIGNLRLGNLAEGKTRPFKPSEIDPRFTP